MIENPVRENCGVAAVSSPEQTDLKDSMIYSIYKLLLSMQNRGQLSAGFTTFNLKRPQILDTYKKNGLVNDVFRINKKDISLKIFERYGGTQGIGHVRYATCGSDDESLAQPFERHHGRKWKWFSFCFNGQIANYLELKQKLLEKEGYHVIYDSDTEIMMHYIAQELRFDKKPDMVDVFANLSEQFDGAYNIAFIDATGQVIIARDPLGIRPMSYGKNNGSVFAASETNALSSCGVYNPISLKPGQMLILNDGSTEVKTFAKVANHAHCMFEWVYFSNVSSIIDEKSVYSVRQKLGINLAKNEPLKINPDTIIVPVPETSKTVCDSMAYELGTTTQDGLLRNRYIGRTFIEGKDRADMVRNKFTVSKEILQGKKVILVDDSVVRGTTMKRLINFIKEVGKAKEVHIRVSCPPIMSPCFYGIDMSTIDELLAPKYYQGKVDEELPEKVTEKIAEDMGADSFLYQTNSGLIDSIGLPKSDICMACLNSDYPTECGHKLYCKALKEFNEGDIGKRTYE